MPMFLVERSFAERMELGVDEARKLMAINADVGVAWLFSFLSADQKKLSATSGLPSLVRLKRS